MALIPLNFGAERMGLLQLNDRREGMFSPEIIAQWERLAGYLSVAISRSQSGDALRESEERFRVMANSIPQLAWIARAEGYIYWYNQRWYEYTGTTPEQMEDCGWQSVHDPEVLPKVLEQWKASITTGRPFDMVFPLRGADGCFRQFLTRVMPMMDSAGQIFQRFGTNTDITERMDMEGELRKSRDELELRVQERTAELNSYMAKLEQSNQALQDFASIAAHDLKEPLRKVISFGNMLRQKSGDSLGQSGNDYLNRILHATGRMQSLLKGLLDYSRIATTSEPFKEVDLSDIIGGVLSDLEARIVMTGGEVRVETLPVISADPTQMRQLFQNLIGNALKFHKRGEKPMVQVRSVSKPDSRYQIIVEDSGIGFEEQYLDKIFAPFQRLHGKDEYEGTGMGLAICKKIVERHGGSITAKSAHGEGASFIITLPIQRTARQTS
ncbi:PAS domain S-box (fragment) [Syntrophobacter sp. SbD1]